MLANVAYQSWIKNDTELEKNYRGVRFITALPDSPHILNNHNNFAMFVFLLHLHVIAQRSQIKEVQPDKFFSAVANLDRWQVVGNLRKLRKRVSRKQSRLSGPATVNAFNYFDLNYIRE